MHTCMCRSLCVFISYFSQPPIVHLTVSLSLFVFFRERLLNLNKLTKGRTWPWWKQLCTLKHQIKKCCNKVSLSIVKKKDAMTNIVFCFLKVFPHWVYIKHLHHAYWKILDLWITHLPQLHRQGWLVREQQTSGWFVLEQTRLAFRWLSLNQTETMMRSLWYKTYHNAKCGQPLLFLFFGSFLNCNQQRLIQC